MSTFHQWLRGGRIKKVARCTAPMQSIITRPVRSAGAVGQAAAAALGAAMRALGPGLVLEVLPLNIKEQLSGQAGAALARTWLLPLMRRHVAGAELAVWAKELLVSVVECEMVWVRRVVGG